ELEGGVGGVVTLVGEVGSGKTRLLHELGDELAAERAEGGSLALRAARTLAAAHATRASTAGPLALALDEPQPPLEDDALTGLCEAATAHPALLLVATRDETTAVRVARAAARAGARHRELPLAA